MQENLLEEHMASKKAANRSILYLFMIGLLLSNSAIFIVYNYQNKTFSEA